jgi:hypothetical protein
MAKKPSLDSFVGPTLTLVNAPGPKPIKPAKPSLTVYLPPKAIRRLKEIGLDNNRRITDIASEAINDWLVAHGHPALADFEK